MKKSFYKKWWFWLIVIIIAIAAFNGGSKNEPKKVDSKAIVNKEKKIEEKKEEKSNAPKAFKVGDVVQLKDFKVTVNKVYTVAGNDFAKPKDGNEFFAIDCTVENISKEDKTISSLIMFKVVDKDGRACEYSITGQTAANAGQMDGEIAQGRKLTGVYVIEVPKGKKGLELVFDSSLLSGGQVIVELR